MVILIIGHDGAFKSNDHINHFCVSQSLVTCSTLAHLLFTVYWMNKSNFLAPQNYRNWQDSIKSMFCSVAMHKYHKVNDYYWFLDSTKRLKQFFGILRLMVRGDLNFSVLGLKNRVGDAATIAQIYAEHLEWYTLSRKLRNSYVRENACAWKGDTDVPHVDEALCWKNSCVAATDILCASGLFSLAKLNYNGFEVNIDVLHPRGETIGIQAGENVDASNDDVQE